jgi:hypothetical protein
MIARVIILRTLGAFFFVAPNYGGIVMSDIFSSTRVPCDPNIASHASYGVVQDC